MSRRLLVWLGDEAIHEEDVELRHGEDLVLATYRTMRSKGKSFTCAADIHRSIRMDLLRLCVERGL